MRPMNLKFLLLQMRRLGDPMRAHEVKAFARTLGCPYDRVVPFDLTLAAPGSEVLAAHDMVLIGGAGDYSVPEGGPWAARAMEAMHALDVLGKPTFASCWGFQALAAALGGSVVNDIRRAELGTLPLQLTEAGQSDPVFRHLGTSFLAQVGHHDTVDVLPSSAIRLASSMQVQNHAFRVADKPIYATQFHPELRVQEMKDRLRNYPHYVDGLTGMSYEVFSAALRETPRANNLLKAFITHVFAD